jgi:hypothetical protein
MHSSKRTIDDMMKISDGHNPYHYILGGGIMENGKWRSYTKKELEDELFTKSIKGSKKLNWQKTKAMFYKNLHEGPNENNLEISKDTGRPNRTARKNREIDANTQEQYDIINLMNTFFNNPPPIYKDIAKKMLKEHKGDIEQMERYEKNYYRQYEDSKAVKTIDTEDTEGAKEVYTKLKQNRPYLGIKEVQKVKGNEFKNATEFELDIAGIDQSRLLSQRNLKSEGIKQTGGKNPIMRYNAKYENLDGDKYKYIRKEISLVPTLNEWVEQAKRHGYEIQVRSYNSNMDVYYNNKPLWGGDNNFKVDTLVDIRAIRKNKSGGIEQTLPKGGLIIEDKYYGRSYDTNKALPQYYSDTSMLFEGRDWDKERKKMTEKLRFLNDDRLDLQEDVNIKKAIVDKIKKKYEKAINKEERNTEKEEQIKQKYKEAKEEYKESKKEYEEVNEKYEDEKNRIGNIPEISKEIKDKFSKDFSPSIEITKVPYSDEILNMNPSDPQYNKNIELLQEKAKSSKSGFYQIDPTTGLTTGIYKLKNDGSIEPRSLTRVMGQYDKDGNFEQYTRDTENFEDFKDRFMTTAIADNHNLLMSYIPRNLTADEVVELAHSAYKKGKDTSYRLGDNEIYLENR